jgi:hypothetical protein
MRFFVVVLIGVVMSQTLLAEPKAAYRFLVRAVRVERDFAATTKYAILFHRFPKKFFFAERLDLHAKHFSEAARTLAVGLREPIERDLLRAVVESGDTLKQLRSAFADDPHAVRALLKKAALLQTKWATVYARKKMALSPQQSANLKLVGLQFDIERMVIDTLVRNGLDRNQAQTAHALKTFESDLKAVESYAYWNENIRLALQRIRMRWENMRTLFEPETLPMLTLLAGIDLRKAIEPLIAQTGGQ